MDNSHPAPKAPLGYGRISATQSNKHTISTSLLTWENGRHLATLSLVPRHLRNERRNSILMTRHYPDLGSDASSVWNFFARFSDVIWRGNQWKRRQMSAVFSGYIFLMNYVHTLLKPKPWCLSLHPGFIISS